MNAVVKFPKVSDEDVKSLRKFYDNVESHIPNLSASGIEMENYSACIIKARL